MVNKIYNRFTKVKEKEDKTYHNGKLSIQKGRQFSREKRKQQNSHKTTDKIALVSSYLSVITFNITVLNSLKAYCGWMDKIKHQLYTAYKRCTSALRTEAKKKPKGWKKIQHEIRKQKRTGVVIAVSDKIDLKPKAVLREKDHFIMIKGIIKLTVILNNILVNRSKERSRQK